MAMFRWRSFNLARIKDSTLWRSLGKIKGRNDKEYHVLESGQRAKDSYLEPKSYQGA